MSIYREDIVNDFISIRHFNYDVDIDELIWHRDLEDRLILPIGTTDWLIQMDNQLPKKINGLFFIPKETYHRIIKGTGNFNIILIKIQSEEI
jgi:hypothetical protein